MKFLAFGNNDGKMEFILMDDIKEIYCAGGHELTIKNDAETIHIGPIDKEAFDINNDNRINLMKRILSDDKLDYNSEYHIIWKDVKITHIHH